MISLKGWKRIPQVEPKSYQDTDLEEPFLHETDVHHRPSTWFSRILRVSFTVANLTVLGCAMLFFFVSMRSHSIHYTNEFNAPKNWASSRNEALKEFSIWSPILDDIDIPMYPKLMNGTLFPPEWLSIARQPPGPEVDEAWEKYEIIRSHVLTKDEVIKLGKDPSIVAKFDNDYWGFGEDAYMAQMDIFHQIHCLNMLRKAAFQDYQPNYEPEARSKMYWIHLHHCVDISLQNIMCTGTTDLLTLNWMEEYSRPWPDFSVYHQCRDFDTLEEWQHLRGVDPHKFDRQVKPKGATEIPAPWLHDENLKNLGDDVHH